MIFDLGTGLNHRRVRIMILFQLAGRWLAGWAWRNRTRLAQATEGAAINSPQELRLDFRTSGHAEALESDWPRPASGTRLRGLQHRLDVLITQGIDELAAH
jgi:hypothetical protein